jgi:dipeptidyl aminopeptidase/acylaminoacyl peptidase
LVVDGKAPGYNAREPMFTITGQHLYTTAPPVSGRPGKEILLDGKPLVRADNVQLFMPPAGDRVWALITSGQFGAPNSQFLFVDGKKVAGSECSIIQNIRFSPDGNHTIADCQTPARSHVALVDGKKGQEYMNLNFLGFTPDSSKPVYIASNGQKSFLVVGDQESDGYNSIAQVSDQTKPPVVYANGGKRIGFAGQVNGNCFVWIDSKVTNRTPQTCPSNFTFSPDGSRYAFNTGYKPLGINIDGTDVRDLTVVPFRSLLEMGTNAGSLTNSFQFSPDGKHIAYSGRSDSQGSFGFVMDSKFTPLETNELMFPTFTPDSRHLIFGALLPALQGVPQVGIFVDGRMALRVSGFPSLVTNIWSREMSPQGVMTLILEDGADLKRYRITPADDTSVDTMIAAGRALK